MSEEHTRTPGRTTARRTVLGSLAGGVLFTALPPRWIRPAVEAVLLPAHAQTSFEPDSEPAQACAAAVIPQQSLLVDCQSRVVGRSQWRVSEDGDGCPLVTQVEDSAPIEDCDIRLQLETATGLNPSASALLAFHNGQFFLVTDDGETSCGETDSGTLAGTCGGVRVTGPYQITNSEIIVGPLSVRFV